MERSKEIESWKAKAKRAVSQAIDKSLVYFLKANPIGNAKILSDTPTILDLNSEACDLFSEVVNEIGSDLETAVY